jgi:type IV secretory pathway VirB9-like protein
MLLENDIRVAVYDTFGMSELEIWVTIDMENNGFDPDDMNDVERYWKERLDDTVVH